VNYQDDKIMNERYLAAVCSLLEWLPDSAVSQMSGSF